jgi:dTDP-4-amino-4,6-dideoxygalactose transaminase
MISVFGSKVGIEEIEEIKTSIENQWIGIGPKTKKFEEDLAERLGVKEFVLLDSGSNSLYMAVKLLKLKPGSEIILPALTWISCATVIVLAGCKPVFCDVEINTQNVSHDTIEPMITDMTGAIMVVHYAGKPVDIDGVKTFGIPIIEDAAHAIDSKIGDKYCGTIGDIGAYSFDGVKNLAIGEAGGITSNNEDYIKMARKLRYCGIEKSGFEASANKDRWWEYVVSDFFVKMIPDDISASIGLAQLRKLDNLQAFRKKIWFIYKEEFSNIGWFEIPVDAKINEQHSYFTYFIRLNNDKRDEFAKYLYQKGIYTTLRYQPLHLIPIYNSTHLKLKNSEKLNEIGLNIPLHPNLSEKDVLYIIETIKEFGKKFHL